MLDERNLDWPLKGIADFCRRWKIVELSVFGSALREDFRPDSDIDFHVRVESCDTCRHYIKTIDVTKDGRAAPVVDELAAIPSVYGHRRTGIRK